MGAEIRSQAAMLALPARARTAVARAQNSLSARLELDRARRSSTSSMLLGIELEESVGILRVPLAGRQQQVAMLGHRPRAAHSMVLRPKGTASRTSSGSSSRANTSPPAAMLFATLFTAMRLSEQPPALMVRAREQQHPWGWWTHRGKLRTSGPKVNLHGSTPGHVSPASSAGNRTAAAPRSPKHAMAVRSGLGIHLDHGHLRRDRHVAEPGGRPHQGGGPDQQQQIGALAPRPRRAPARRPGVIPEPHHASGAPTRRTCSAAAARERHGAIDPLGAAAAAAQDPEASVQLDHVAASRRVMELPSTFWVTSVKESAALSSATSARARDSDGPPRRETTPPVVPLPDGPRIPCERLGCGEIFGAKRSPQAAIAAEGRDPALRRDSGARERDHTARGAHSLASAGDRLDVHQSTPAAAGATGVALVGARHSHHGRVVKGTAGDLKPDRKSIGVEPARQADRRRAGEVERNGAAVPRLERLARHGFADCERRARATWGRPPRRTSRNRWRATNGCGPRSRRAFT